MTDNPDRDVTRLLARWKDGDEDFFAMAALQAAPGHDRYPRKLQAGPLGGASE